MGGHYKEECVGGEGGLKFKDTLNGYRKKQWCYCQHRKTSKILNLYAS